MALDAGGHIVAQIDGHIAHGQALAQHPRAAGLIVPEAPAHGPLRILAVQHVLATIGSVKEVSPLGGFLVCHGADHKLVNAVGVGIVGQVLDVGQRVLVGDVGESLARGNQLAVGVGSAGALLDVVVALGLVSPELALGLVHQLFHLDGVTRHAECTADGLRRQGEPLGMAQPVELAIIIGGDEVADGAAQVI